MKTVFNKQELAHVWANQRQERGKSGSMFFEGKSIYSYGYHFKIAEYVKPGIVLFNSASYSNTTEKHKNHVRRAIPNCKMVYIVPNVGDMDHKANVMAYVTDIHESYTKAKRAIKYFSYHHETAEELRWALRRYLKDFSRELRGKFTKTEQKQIKQLTGMWACFTDAEIAERSKKLEAYQAKADAKREQARTARIEAQRADYDLFKQGNTAVWGNFYDYPVALRINGDQIETSRRASIPLAIALRFWKHYQEGKDVSSYNFGNYKADSFKDGILKVGCHDIPVSELERIAGILGLTANKGV